MVQFAVKTCALIILLTWNESARTSQPRSVRSFTASASTTKSVVHLITLTADHTAESPDSSGASIRRRSERTRQRPIGENDDWIVDIDYCHFDRKRVAVRLVANLLSIVKR